VDSRRGRSSSCPHRGSSRHSLTSRPCWTRTTASPVDVVAARGSHGRGQREFRLVAYEEWEIATLSGEGRYALVEVSLDSDNFPERCIEARWENDVPTEPEQGFFRPVVYKHCPYSTREEIGTGTWARPDEHSLVLAASADLLVPRHWTEHRAP
jgi:hypothetical protein